MRKTNQLVSIIPGVIIAGLFSFAIYAYATFPNTLFSPGETLNPHCQAGATNCNVEPPVPYVGATQSLNLGSNDFYTSGTIAGGSIKLSPATSGNLSIFSDKGAITFGGEGNVNNNHLTLDFETYAKAIGVSSDTASAVNFGSLNVMANQFKAGTAVVNGLEMKDQVTGATYCVTINNGAWNMEKGNCGQE